MRSIVMHSLLLTGLVLMGLAACAQEPSPHFLGTVLPAPPQQSAAWTPPASTLPAAVLSCAKTFFAQGLADPRGCDYRAIEVAVGSCWTGDVGVVKTHGWVLPAAEGAAEQFAVCWSGLVYPVVKVGEAADARADGLAMAASEDARRAAYIREYPQSSYRHWEVAFTEQQAVSMAAILPLKALLLLRIGEEEAARKVWQSCYAGEDANRNKPESDPYLSLASDWGWALFDRTLCAHMRGDDHLALAGARLLTHIYPLIDAEVQRRGLETPDYGNRHLVSRSLSFLEELPELLADQERRAKVPHPADALPITPRRYPDAAKRIAALIDQFDEIQAVQMGQPGGVYLANAITKQVVGEGDAAVEPLLHCLETDTRLSRSVCFGRDFARAREIMGVRDAAYNALTEILHTNSFDSGVIGDNVTAHGPEERRRMVESIRRYWKRFGGIPLEERWYQTLKDDAALPAHWVQAANNIACPTDVTTEDGWISTPGRKPGEIPTLRGEVLRKKANPSVTELLSKRAHQLLERGNDPSLAGELTKDLTVWNPQGSAADVHQLFLSLLAQRDSQTQCSMTYLLGQLFDAREQYGAPGTLPDYAEWARTLMPNDSFATPKYVFKLMWRHPEQPDIARTAAWLFSDPHSPWVPLLGPSSVSYSSNLPRLLQSPLLSLAPFRSLVLRGLEDTGYAGKITVSPTGKRMDFSTDFGWSTGLGNAEGDVLKPAAGATIDVRICDMYSQYLSAVIGRTALRALLAAGVSASRGCRLRGVPAPLYPQLPVCPGDDRTVWLPAGRNCDALLPHARPSRDPAGGARGEGDFLTEHAGRAGDQTAGIPHAGLLGD